MSSVSTSVAAIQDAVLPSRTIPLWAPYSWYCELLQAIRWRISGVRVRTERVSVGVTVSFVLFSITGFTRNSLSWRVLLAVTPLGWQLRL